MAISTDPPPDWDPKAFLRDWYNNSRKHLEDKMSIEDLKQSIEDLKQKIHQPGCREFDYLPYVSPAQVGLSCPFVDGLGRLWREDRPGHMVRCDVGGEQHDQHVKDWRAHKPHFSDQSQLNAHKVDGVMYPDPDDDTQAALGHPAHD